MPACCQGTGQQGYLFCSRPPLPACLRVGHSTGSACLLTEPHSTTSKVQGEIHIPGRGSYTGPVHLTCAQLCLRISSLEQSRITHRLGLWNAKPRLFCFYLHHQSWNRRCPLAVQGRLMSQTGASQFAPFLQSPTLPDTRAVSPHSSASAWALGHLNANRSPCAHLVRP